MTAFHPLRTLPDLASYSEGDVLVIFGEVFGRGYVNGLIDAAEARGMSVIYGTVGRRDGDGALRPLTPEELDEKGHGPIINLPLEAGFDKEDMGSGESLVGALNAIGKEWENASLDFSAIETGRTKGEARFRAQVSAYLDELKQHIPAGKKVLFAHTMAGGIPASKRVLVVSNRIFKGVGARHQSSEVFWDSDMGKACAISFEEVTARTLHHLIELSADLRSDIKAKGGEAHIVAYGYHGTECMMEGAYKWQTYAPYLQGFAKIALENVAAKAHANGDSVSVYNAPEILTNSSGIFVGVELPLYRLILAIEQETEHADAVRALCAEKLEGGLDGLAKVREILQKFHRDPQVQYLTDFTAWPQHNTQEQMDLMIACASELRALHKDGNDLITGVLSRLVFSACGHVMLHNSCAQDAPVYWLGHDIVAKALGEIGVGI